jgi:hypothetical protein
MIAVIVFVVLVLAARYLATTVNIVDLVKGIHGR